MDWPSRRTNEQTQIMKRRKEIRDPKKEHEDYLAFLKKRLESENYKANVSPEEYAKTKRKYDNAKLKAKLLK